MDFKEMVLKKLDFKEMDQKVMDFKEKTTIVFSKIDFKEKIIMDFRKKL